MAKGNFHTCVEYVIKSEGAQYTNDPHDPGGPTKYGITLTDVRLHIKKNATAADVKKLTKGQAVTVYREKYWDALHCDDLPAGLDYSVLDYGVNSGIGRAGKELRSLIGMPQNTWQVTPAVVDKISKFDLDNLIILFDTDRLCFLLSLGTWKYFGRGWGARVVSVKKLSLGMANPIERGDMFLEFPHGPAFGPGKGIDMPEHHTYNLPSSFEMASAALGALIAIRTRRCSEN